MIRRGSYIALREKLGIPRGVSRDEMRRFWTRRHYRGDWYDWTTHCAVKAGLDAMHSAKVKANVDKIEELVRSRRRVAV